MGKAMIDRVTLLTEIQNTVLAIRKMGKDTTDPRRRDACAKVADAIEDRARELDRYDAVWGFGSRH